MKQIDELMQKEVTRREFLTLVGAGLVSIIGFTGLIRTLLDKQHHQSSGYGSSGYGR